MTVSNRQFSVGILFLLSIGLISGYIAGCATTRVDPDGTTTTTSVDLDAVTQAILLAQQVMPGVADMLTQLWAAQAALDERSDSAEFQSTQARIQALIDLVNAVKPLLESQPAPAGAVP